MALAASGDDGVRAAIALLESQEEVAALDWEQPFLLGYFHLQAKEFERAASFFSRCCELNPANPNGHYFRGIALAMNTPSVHKGWAIRRDHAKRALALVEKAAAPNSWPNLKSCLELLARAATYVGPSRDAEYAYRWLIRLEPDNSQHYEDLSQIRADDDLDESVLLLERALAIDPGLTARTDLDLARDAIGGRAEKNRLRIRAKYPTTEELSGDLRSVIRSCLLDTVRKEQFIRPETKFFTLGSCFAREIAGRLIARGYDAGFLEVSEHINSTYANRCMVDWALGQCTGQPQARLDELFSGMQLTPERLRALWTNANVLIYTLGVAPVFRDKQSGDFIMPKSSSLNARTLAELYEFRTTSVDENLRNLEYIRDRLLKLNGNLKFIVTVSPVPLRMTFEFASAIHADCISKSTLRVVAHEFVTKYPDAVYWPSFEVVRWIGGHAGPFFGTDDGASLHVGDDVVSAITDSFIEYFS